MILRVYQCNIMLRGQFVDVTTEDCVDGRTVFRRQNEPLLNPRLIVSLVNIMESCSRFKLKSVFRSPQKAKCISGYRLFFYIEICCLWTVRYRMKKTFFLRLLVPGVPCTTIAYYCNAIVYDCAANNKISKDNPDNIFFKVVSISKTYLC